MKINVLTLFPEMFSAVTGSILGKAAEKGLLEFNFVQIRDFSRDKHHKADDYPFGGGPGMVMLADPIFGALNSIDAKGKKILYMSPRGKVLDQEMITALSQEGELTILCGHYEGVDQRVIDTLVDEQISIGDYVLTGGELPAMVLADSISRMLEGVLPNDEAKELESHYNGLLEYPQYTRPYEWNGLKIPDVLMSGHHGNVDKWRREQSLLMTAKYRPDMLEKAELTKADREFLKKQDL